MFKKIAIGFGTASLLAMAQASYAGSTAVTLTVSASVTENCNVTNTATLAFGAYDPVSANASTAKTGAATIAMTCTKGANGVTIDVANGSNFSGGTRRLKASGSATFLNYAVYQPDTGGSGCTALSTAWVSGTPYGVPSTAFTGVETPTNV